MLPAESRVAGWCSGVLPVWWVLGWGWLPGAGIGDTPAAAWFGGGGCPCVVWGWHAVGVLGQCALVARPVWVSVLCVLCLVWWGVRWGSVAGVGGLVVNCIVDASILL